MDGGRGGRLFLAPIAVQYLPYNEVCRQITLASEAGGGGDASANSTAALTLAPALFLAASSSSWGVDVVEMTANTKKRKKRGEKNN